MCARGARWATCLTLLTTAAHADSPLDDRHADGYYVARGGAVLAAMGATIAATALLRPTPPVSTQSEWLGWDNALRGRLSTEASDASDVTLLTAMAVPLGVELTYGFDTRTANTSILYAEVVWANVLLNTAVKYAAPRWRPYHYRDPVAAAYVESQSADAFLSFYSGHASTAFAAAVGGAYLFSAAHPQADANPWLWGVESCMATATTIWRVRAGKHFYSDVIVGAVVGSAIGIGIPLLEGVHHRPSAMDLTFAGGGVLFGGVAAMIAPFEEDGAATRGENAISLKLVPTFDRRAAGITALGRF